MSDAGLNLQAIAKAGGLLLATAAVAGGAWAICNPPTPGPDVIVGSLFDLASSYTDATGVNDLQAYSVGTKSLNIGNKDLEWISSTNHHPVIGMQMYRWKSDFDRPAGRLEMVGMSWLKHGFTALAETEFCGGNCSFEPGHGSGPWLGMGCADPYWATLNGDQSRLGPRGQVNAFSGFYPYDSSHAAGTSPAAINKRLQVANPDVDPALNVDALYFVEGQYVNSDDALAGNGFNNASYRQVTVDASKNLAYAANGVNRCHWSGSTSGTFCEVPAIFAWAEVDPEVRILQVDVPGEGRFHVARRILDNGDGTWRYEYAIHNLNSDRSARAFTVDFGDTTAITDGGFHGVPHHSGDCLVANPPVPGNVNACGPAIDDADWTIQVAPEGSITWSTSDFAVMPEANALRWGTLFNFWFDADRPPSAMLHRITLFKPGSPTDLQFDFDLFSDGFESGDSSAWSLTDP